jgi:hypothetical protein
LADDDTFGCIVGRALYDGQVSLPALLSLAPDRAASRSQRTATPSTHTT